MQKRTKKWGIAAVIATSIAATALWVQAGSNEESQIRQRLTQAVPKANIVSVTASPIAGVYAVELDGGTIYASADGQYLIQGDMLQVKGKEVVNITDQAKSKQRLVLLKGIDKRDEIIFPAKGKAKAVITVFTDTDCGYCRKLHAEVPAMNAKGIEVRYLAYPRDLPRVGANAGTGARMTEIWCSANPAQALTLAKQGRPVAAGKADCKAPIAEQFALGRKMGVTGTPAVFSEKGEQLGGYITADRAATLLGLN